MPVTNTLLSGDHAVDRVQHNSAILTPEATAAIIDRAVPGIPEAMRAESMKITPHGILSRGIAGIRKRTLIINLPGSPKAVKENLSCILPSLNHALLMLTGGTQDCAAAGVYT